MPMKWAFLMANAFAERCASDTEGYFAKEANAFSPMYESTWGKAFARESPTLNQS
jgi:hypothetical protein